MEDQQLLKIKKIISEQRENGRTVAVRKGVYDLLHPDHVASFEAMKKLAYIAVVLILSDVNAGKIKPGRPIMDQEARLTMLRSQRSVDYAELDYSSMDEQGNYSRDLDADIPDY